MIPTELYALSQWNINGVYKTVCFLALYQFLKKQVFPDRNREDPAANCPSKDW